MNRANSNIDDPLQLSRRISDLDKENKELLSKLEAYKHTITRLRVERNILLEKLSEEGISLSSSTPNPKSIDLDLEHALMECSPDGHVPRIAAPAIAVYNHPLQDVANESN
ncbi:hypothetical protein MDAP_001024 [Mitosporidium daphniae]